MIPPIAASVSLPRPTVAPSTIVTHVFPSGDVIPENQLRMYIEFSAPMGRRSGIEYVALLDERGQEVEGPFLPLDYEFWNADRTRFTVFFDPGRVKHDILPNKQMGRALKIGKSYTVLVRSEWQDANGLPLRGIIPSHVSRRATRHPSARHRAVAHRAAQGRRSDASSS